MKISKTVRYLVRVREFETVHVEVGAEISHYDIGFDDFGWASPSQGERNNYIEYLRSLLDFEVDQMSRRELQQIAEWSEITPNLAEDYLETTPVSLQRKQHARKPQTSTTATPSRRVRRGGAGGGTSSPAPRPIRPQPA